MKNRKGKGFIVMGLLLIAAAFLLVLYNMREENQARHSAEQARKKLEAYIPAQDSNRGSDASGTDGTDPADRADAAGEAGKEVSAGDREIPDYILNPHMEMPVQTIDGVDYIGKLEIPAYGLELPVIADWSYPMLKISPCRYFGSVYTDNMIIAAHNFVSHFGNLKYLVQGDSVYFTDMDGNRFSYEVAVCEILQPMAEREMKSGSWDLTLFTCTIGGASRVTVRCVRSKTS